MTPLERAKSDLVRMRGELGRLQVQAEMLNGRIQKVESYIEMASFYEAEEDGLEAARSRGGGVSAIAVGLTVEMLKSRGKPIHTREIIKILEEKGVTIGGSNPVANLSGFLSRSEELSNSRALGWGLAEWSLERNEPPKKTMMQRLEEMGANSEPPPTAEVETTEPSGWSPTIDDLDDEIPF